MRHALRFAALAFGLSILFCATAAHAQHQIRLRDEKGQPVKNAEVIIDCDGNKHEGLADAGGTYSWGRMNGPIQCALIISSASTETFADVLDIPARGVVSRVIVLTRKRMWVVQVTVTDEENRSPVFGVDVKFDCGFDTNYRTTNGSGVAELDKILAATECTITTDHKLYEPLTTTIAVPKGMTEPVSHPIKIKRKINIKTVKVTVVDSESDKPIQDARVLLTGRFYSSYSGVTDASGVADVLIDRSGRFDVEVKQDNYYPGKLTMSVEAGAEGESLLATVSMRRKKNQNGVPLAVTVKGKRLDGAIVNLRDARVRVEGSDEAIPDSDGKVTVSLPGFSGDSVSVSASANGYESETKSFSVPRFSAAIIAPELTFILTEKKRETTGVNLIIEITNKDDGKPVSGASVSIDGQGSTKTDSDGYARFTISNEFIKGETYLRAMVSKSDFKEKWSDIGIDLLKPREEPRYYSIVIEKAAENRDRIFWGTWTGTGNAKGITMTINRDYTMTFSDTRPGYEKSGKGGWGRDTSRVDFIAAAIGYGFWYHADGRLSDPWGNFYVK